MPPCTDGAYRAPRWLPDAHSQTIWPAIAAPRATVDYQRVRWPTPDGDFVDIDFTRALPGGDVPRPLQGGDLPRPPVNGGSNRPGDAQGERDDPRPLLVLFHGLEGNSNSHYARALMAAARQRGWRSAVAHFRGCSGSPNLLARAYHSGDSEEIDWLLRRFKAQHAARAPLYAAGVSLGGNALLKWLGERGEDAGRIVRAAAAISAPQDLQAGAEALSRGFSRLYSINFMKTLVAKSIDKLARFPGLYDRDAVRASRSFFDFDHLVTAPLHGFASCYDYWQRSSSRQFLGGVRVPVLVLNALNDPFMPADVLARPDQVSSWVKLDYPRQGGHVGFLSGRFPGSLDWLGERVMGFYDHG